MPGSWNVTERLSGGKGTIRRHKGTKKNPKGESLKDFYARLKGVLEENADDNFKRWKVVVTEADMKRFDLQTLNNVLQQIVDWYDWVSSPEGIANPFDNPIHFRYPYGCYNPILEGNADEFDAYFRTGSTAGLTRNELFSELQ